MAFHELPRFISRFLSVFLSHLEGNHFYFVRRGAGERRDAVTPPPIVVENEKKKAKDDGKKAKRKGREQKRNDSLPFHRRVLQRFKDDAAASASMITGTEIGYRSPAPHWLAAAAFRSRPFFTPFKNWPRQLGSYDETMLHVRDVGRTWFGCHETNKNPVKLVTFANKFVRLPAPEVCCESAFRRLSFLPGLIVITIVGGA